MASIKKNIGLQTVYQVINTCMPLITAPYLARVLGAASLGIFSYTSSLVGYFTLIAMLGTINHGTRCIATVKSDKEARSRAFWSIYALQLAISIVVLLCYMVFLNKCGSENRLILIIQGLALVACIFDISWFFFGMEMFSFTVTRGMIIKLVTVASILLLVRTPDDLWKYTLIMLGGTALSQLLLWIGLPGRICFYCPTWADIKVHVKPNLALFLPLLAMSVYHYMDKTMLGMLSSFEQSGYYYNSDKVINIPLNVINGIGTVMLPRMTSLFSGKRIKEANRVLIVSIEGIIALTVAMAFGIAAVSKEFIPLFFGAGYDACILLTMVFSPILVLKSISVTVRTQYLVPLKRERELTLSVVAGAIVNLFANLILIPRFGALGAVIATLLAEFTACLIQLRAIGRELLTVRFRLSCAVYIVAGTLMYFCISCISNLPISDIPKLPIKIVLGVALYGSACLCWWRYSKNDLYTALFSGKRNG